MLDLGRLQLLLGNELAVIELFLALVVVSISLHPGLGLDELGAVGLDQGPVPFGVGLVLGGVKLEQELAGLDFLAFEDADLADPAGDVSADVDVLLRFHLSRGGNQGGQVVGFDRLGGDLDRFFPLGPEVEDDD